MKKAMLMLMAVVAMIAQAQIEGTEYYLPKTQMRFQLLVERTIYTPGEFAKYSGRFLKKNANTDEEVMYRMVGIDT